MKYGNVSYFFDIYHIKNVNRFGVSISKIRTTYSRHFKMCIHLFIKSTNSTDELNWDTIEQLTVETSPT